MPIFARVAWHRWPAQLLTLFQMLVNASAVVPNLVGPLILGLLLGAKCKEAHLAHCITLSGTQVSARD
jgi:hypothetical protein